MLLTQDSYASQYHIKQVTAQAVHINDVVYTQSLLVMPHKIISPWRPQTFQAVLEQDFELLFLENREVVLLGVGEQGARLPLALYHALLTKKIVVECMSLAAACRTYNILHAEGRYVAAALIF
jgi:uncharacterized protein